MYECPAELITLPLLSLSPRDPLEITIQCHFPAAAAQRPVSGALVMENYQLAQMKWPLERTLKTYRPLPPSLRLSILHYHSLNFLSLSLCRKHAFETVYEMHYEDPLFCTISTSYGTFCNGGVLNDNYQTCSYTQL